LLFGLAFDTATEIGLLGISASEAAHGMSFWTILVFPALFTAGMSLLDTADSVLMTRAYGCTLADPLRELWYNLTITAASVVVAFFVGGIEALGLIGSKLRLEGAFWAHVGNLNDSLSAVGFAIVAIFIAGWLAASLLYRIMGFEARFSRRRAASHL
jgi:high-affinity nickel-transport protein